jgi:hypothetical protein
MKTLPMEPAEERPDDCHVGYPAGTNVWLQWSRPRTGRMTEGLIDPILCHIEPQRSRPGGPGDRHMQPDPVLAVAAAMEPTGDRPEDAIELPDYQIGPTPQWGQPRIGWVTTAVGTLNYINWTPQWSQPRIGWVTQRTGLMEAVGTWPQWSQPRTRLDGLQRGYRYSAGRAAAMEPAGDQSDGRESTRWAAPGLRGRDGASRRPAG